MNVSANINELTLAQLILINQGLAREVDKLREQQIYLKAKIQERLARGESEHAPPPAEGSGDAVAPGAVVTVTKA